MLPLTDPPRTRFEWVFSLLTEKSRLNIAEDPPEATDPEEMDCPRTERASMRLAAAEAVPPVRLLYTSETYSMKEVRWEEPRWPKWRLCPLDTSRYASATR